jgi:hypothetical protein
LNFNAITHTVCTSKKGSGKKELSKKAREATPIKMAEWLISVANLCNSNINKNK